MQNFNNTNENATAKNGNGANTATLIGCRIAGAPTYAPAHINQGGKQISAQCTFNVFQNIRGKRMVFNITAWGKMADSIARGGATGKEVTIIASLNSYKGRVWLPTQQGMQPQFVTLPDGSPMQIDKIGFTIENLSWGADSAKTIQEEIMTGLRPQGWNDPTQAGHAQWQQECARRNAIQFQPGMEFFGYAKVRQVQGQIVANNVATQGQPQAGTATQYQANPNAVAGAMPAQPQGAGYQQNAGGGNQAGWSGQTQPQGQVQVNGVNMGYAMPQNQAPVQPQGQTPVQNGYAAQPQGQAPANAGYAPQGQVVM